MRALFAVAVVWLSGCQCGAPPCESVGGDAGPALREQGEPCTDGFACELGLTCIFHSSPNQDFAQQVCLAPCGDAGTCPMGSACLNPEGRATDCHTTCAVDADCGGRFTMTCRAVDAGPVRGVCGARACRDTSECLGGTCITPAYCCPPGAPCAAPPPGFCIR
jgi:hypothetical protein